MDPVIQLPAKPPSLPPKPPLLSPATYYSTTTTTTCSDDDHQQVVSPSSQSSPIPPPVPSRQHITSMNSSQLQSCQSTSSKNICDDKEGSLGTRSPAKEKTPNPKLSLLPKSAELQNYSVYEDIQPSKREQLSDIVTDCSVLPMKVAFCDSIYGFCESFTFTSNELFDVHFLKESVFADVRTSSGKQVKIPLQAPFQYSLDYPPNSICDAEYKVPQLMKLTYLPTIAIVKDGGNGRFKFRSNKSSEFMAGEVLIFKGRIKSSTIECFSLSHKETKKLHKSSELTLTINPSRSTFMFTNLIFFDFPLQVNILSTPKLQPKFKSASTIVSLTKEKSLITSFSDPKVRDDVNVPALYEIFIDAPIDFQKAYIASAEKQSLIEKTESVFERFSPMHIKRVVTNVNNDNLQKQLYDTLTYPGLGDEQWKNVTELVKPSLCFNKSFPKQHKEEQQVILSPDLPTPLNEAGSDYDTIDSSCYTSMTSPPPTPVATSSPKPPHLSQPTSMGPTESHADYTTVTRKKSLSLQTTHHSDPDEAQYLKLIPNDSHEVEKTHQQLKLEDLSCDQVLCLLDKLGLSKYKNLFIEEKISGSILQELDEDMLEQDLGITSKLHRLKLKRVIEGREILDNFCLV